MRRAWGQYIYSLAGGGGIEEVEGFRHPMLELAAIYGIENEFVRRGWRRRLGGRGIKGSLGG